MTRGPGRARSAGSMGIGLSSSLGSKQVGGGHNDAIRRLLARDSTGGRSSSKGRGGFTFETDQQLMTPGFVYRFDWTDFPGSGAYDGTARVQVSGGVTDGVGLEGGLPPGTQLWSRLAFPADDSSQGWDGYSEMPPATGDTDLTGDLAATAKYVIGAGGIAAYAMWDGPGLSGDAMSAEPGSVLFTATPL